MTPYLYGLREAITRKGRLRFAKPHMAFFDGDDTTGDVTEDVLQFVERQRKADKAHASVP